MAEAAPFLRRNLIPLAAVLIATVFAVFQAVAGDKQPDLFIYRLGAEIGLRGESPYHLERIRERVAEQFPDQSNGPDSLVNNCGFFLPPMGVLVFAPFAALPWPDAKIAWAFVSAFALFGITRIPSLFRDSAPPAPSPIWSGLVPFLLVVNFLALAIVQVGQTTVLVVGCIAFGQWCFEKNRPTLGILLWSVAFIKPHVAIPLLPLAWYLGGWKRAAGLLAAAAGLNLAGACIIGSPLVLRDYLDFLAAGHKAVVYNLVERNPEITSWNRLFYVCTGVLLEQTAATTLASYLIWFGLVLGRCAVAGKRPSAPWAVAAAGVAAAWCPQILAYEAFHLVLVVPWLRELFQLPAATGRQSGWRRIVGILAALLLLVELLPYPAAAAVGIEFHRPLAVALIAVLVLLGPIKSPADSGVAPASSR